MAKLSTTKRGYGAHHQALRKAVRPQMEAGVVPCARCGVLIAPEERWELDHAPGKQGYLGPSDVRCNRSAGGRVGAAITNSRRSAQPPSTKRPWSRVWWEPVPDDVVVLGDD